MLVLAIKRDNSACARFIIEEICLWKNWKKNLCFHKILLINYYLWKNWEISLIVKILH